MDSFCDYNGICSAFLIICIVRGKICTLWSVGNTLYRPSESAMQTVSHGNWSDGKGYIFENSLRRKNITFDRICRNSYRDNSRLLGRRFWCCFNAFIWHADGLSWFHFYNCTCKLSWYRTSKSDFGNDHNRMDLLCKN